MRDESTKQPESGRRRPRFLYEAALDEAASEGEKRSLGRRLFTGIFGLPFRLVDRMTVNFPWFLRWPLRMVGYPLVVLGFFALVLGCFYGVRSLGYDLEKLHEMPERSVILDRNGIEIGRVHGEKRDVIRLSEVSQPFRAAILAREDSRFYRHFGVDPVGIVRAVVNNARGKREGASTITQQLASDLFQLKGASRKNMVAQLDRKCLEMALALRLEARYSKDEILEGYVNSINWGRQIRGIEEASRVYFEKRAAKLDLSESAMLAGIVRGPDAYNPFRNMEAAIRERNTTLARMVATKSITQGQADAAKKEELKVRPESRRDVVESYALQAVRRDLDLILEKENLTQGGLVVTTTIDMRLQLRAEASLEKRLKAVEGQRGYGHMTRAAWLKKVKEKRGEATYLQGSLVIFENQTGGVVAMVGGRNANESQFDRAVQARRPIGSIFKPFVYLSAFDAGLSTEAQISDAPIQPGEIAGAPRNWHPQNSDRKYNGMLDVATGLIRSRNTMSIRVGNFAGMDRVKEVARQVGFSQSFESNPAAFLGTWDASSWEVASAYTVFPNDGLRFKPYLIREIRDRHGKVLYAPKPISYQATEPGSAWAVSRILAKVVDSGTAATVRSLGFKKPCAGKTGTTNDFRDAWFAGYTSNLTCAVWVGLDRPDTITKSGYGATLALPVWVDVMKSADQLGYPSLDLHQKQTMVDVAVCRVSGKRPTSGCMAAHTVVMRKMPISMIPPDNEFCTAHPIRAIAVDEDDMEQRAQSDAERDVQQAPAPATVPNADDDVEMEPSPVPIRAVPVDEPILQPKVVRPAPVRAEPVQSPEAARPPVRVVPKPPQPVRAEPVTPPQRAEPVQPPVRAEEVRPAPARAEPVRAEPPSPVRAEPAAPVRAEPAN